MVGVAGGVFFVFGAVDADVAGSGYGFLQAHEVGPVHRVVGDDEAALFEILPASVGKRFLDWRGEVDAFNHKAAVFVDGVVGCSDAGAGTVDASPPHVWYGHYFIKPGVLVWGRFFVHWQDVPGDVLQTGFFDHPDHAEVRVPGEVPTHIEVAAAGEELPVVEQDAWPFAGLVECKGDELPFFVGRDAHVRLVVNLVSDRFTLGVTIGALFVFCCFAPFVAHLESADLYPASFFEDAIEEPFGDGLLEGDAVVAEPVFFVLADQFSKEGAFAVVVGAVDHERKPPGCTGLGSFEKFFLVFVVAELVDDDFSTAADDGGWTAADDPDAFTAAEAQAADDVFIDKRVVVEFARCADDFCPLPAVLDELLGQLFVASGDKDVPITVGKFNGAGECLSPGEPDLPRFICQFAKALVPDPFSLIGKKEFLQQVKRALRLRRHRGLLRTFRLPCFSGL